MTCPPEIAEILAEILTTGILRIRSGNWPENNRRWVIEADHIHNLPALLTHFSFDLLKYYWEAERPSFMSYGSKSDWKGFEPLWAKLACHVPADAEQLASR